MPTAEANPSAYELKITLLGIFRPIWRRIRVPGSMFLSDLHETFQIVMGWNNCHLHQFEKGKTYWGLPQHDGFDDAGIDERRVQLSQALDNEGDVMVYVYDFGDDWRHEVSVEKIIPADPDSSLPICLGGERRCPPEDVGGPKGYLEFLDVIFQPGHDEFATFRGWAGGTFHAEEFDVAAVNKALERAGKPVRSRR